MTSHLSHDVVICTRNRPDELARALGSIATQTRLPDRITVVDASDDNRSRDVVDAWRDTEVGAGILLEHVVATPGLPHQRNVAAARSPASVLHFVDDDVALDPGYLQALAQVFEDDRTGDIVGAGGLITNQPPRHVRLWWRLALLDSTRSGVVLASGKGVIVTDARQPLNVEWLSGCSMSYRSELVRDLRFDDTLSGYALMEDVDFGFRASRAGRLVLEPAARLVHHVSPVERWDHARRHRVETARRGWFVEKHLGTRGLIAFWWSVVAGTIVEVGIASAERRRWRLRVAGWRLLGAWDFLRGAR